MYRIDITITSKDESCEILLKTIHLPELENLLSIDLPSLYAEAQQNEINEGLDLVTDDEFNYQMNNVDMSGGDDEFGFANSR